MKWLKMTICIVSIIILILITMIVILLQNKDGVIILDETKSDNKENEPIKNATIQKVKDREEYYTVKYILDTYFEYVNYIDATAEELEMTTLQNQEEMLQNYTETGMEGLKNIVDEAYFKEGKTEQELRKNVVKTKNKSFRVDSLYSQEKTLTKTAYFAYLTLDYQKETKVIIKVDSISNGFSILPEDYINQKNYSEKNLNEIEVTNIEINENNEYEYITVTDKMMAQSYLEDYADRILNDTQKSYEVLEEAYKQKKFPTWQSYQNYITNTEKDYEMLRAKDYYTSQDGENNIYVCKDQYGNSYVFKESAVMEYTVQLDDYTLENKMFEEQYREANNRDRGILNIEKFFSMINIQDYQSAYEVLDANFKQTNFKTEADFENYMKNKVFRYNKVNYQTYNDEISGIYSYNMIVLDATGKSQNQIEFSIVMKLLEGTNFVMSFTI